MCCSQRYPTLPSPALWKHYQPKSHITQSLNTRSRETTWLIFNGHTCITCWLCCFFSRFLLFLLCSFSNSQSHFTGNPSSSYSSVIPVTVYHACTSELSADLGRSFSKRKKIQRQFSQLELPSHLKPIQQYSSCLTLHGFSWQRWFCLVMSNMLLPKASGCFWWMALLDPKFSASRISTRRTAHLQHLISQCFLLYSKFLYHTWKYPNYCRIQPSFHPSLHYTAILHLHEV